MPLDQCRFDFDNLNLSVAPEQPGVYALYIDGEIEETIYYGSSTVSIRERLKDHKSGSDGPCTQQATHYNYELGMVDPVAHEGQLLLEYKRINGRLPRCNSVIP